MIKLNKLTDYAIVLMAELVRHPDQLLASQELALRCHLEPPTSAKVLKQLTTAGLVESVRGAGGGYRLSDRGRSPSIADVIQAMDGPIALTECSVHSGLCAQETVCGMRHHWHAISRVIADALDGISLADLASLPTTGSNHEVAPIPRQTRS